MEKSKIKQRLRATILLTFILGFILGVTFVFGATTTLESNTKWIPFLLFLGISILMYKMDFSRFIENQLFKE